MDKFSSKIHKVHRSFMVPGTKVAPIPKLIRGVVFTASLLLFDYCLRIPIG